MVCRKGHDDILRYNNCVNELHTFYIYLERGKAPLQSREKERTTEMWREINERKSERRKIDEEKKNQIFIGA